MHGRRVADIVPSVERVHSMPSELFVRELETTDERWRRAGVRGDPADYDTGLTTDDL